MTLDNAIPIKDNLALEDFKSTVDELGIAKYPLVEIEGRLASLIDIPDNGRDYATLFNKISKMYIEYDGKIYYTSNEGFKEIILQYFRENIKLRKEVQDSIKNRKNSIEKYGIDLVK